MLDFTYTVIQGLEVWLAGLYGLALLLVGAGIGFFVSYYLKKSHQVQLEKEAEGRATRRLAEEERTQSLALLEEKDHWYKLKVEQEKEIEGELAKLSVRQKDTARRDRELSGQQEEVSKDLIRIKSQEGRLVARERSAQGVEAELAAAKEQYREKLELAASLTADEAKEHLFEQLAQETKARYAAIIRMERTRAQEESDREAKKIIAQAINRCAVEEAEHSSTSTVTLPNENLKSRIIGKEGRNVRTFEAATGVRVVVDDTPDTILLSCFDPIKRQVATLAMARLVKDGGFTPHHIEDVVGESQKLIDKEIEEAGRKALNEIGAKDVHADLPKTIGRLKFRTSYGQNQLQHCLEVAQLSGLMAAEIGVDANLARRAALLHDIGKTVSQELEGTHIDLGVEMADRFGEHPVVKEVIAEHHEDHARLDPICFLVKAADSISSIRPGGRREDLEGYARRIVKLEEIATSFGGVKDVYAINAGRELRVMVRGDRIDDDSAEILAFDIAKRVSDELTFAGEVKVMVVRETRSTRYTGNSNNRRGGNNNNNNNNKRSQSNRRGGGSRRSRNGGVQSKAAPRSG